MKSKIKLITAARVLESLRDGMNCTQLSKKIDRMFSSTVQSINKLESIKLIKTEHIGRNRLIHFTKRGKRVKELLEDIKQQVGTEEVD